MTDFVIAVRREFREDPAVLEEVVQKLSRVEGVRDISPTVGTRGLGQFTYTGRGGIENIYGSSGLSEERVFIEPVIYLELQTSGPRR